MSFADKMSQKMNQDANQCMCSLSSIFQHNPIQN